MSKTVLLLGLRGIVVDEVKDKLNAHDVRLFGGGSIEDARAVFAQGRVDHVIMGAGIDLEMRLDIVREIFQLSEVTTVHMKDYASGPQGFLPFVQAVLDGISKYEINDHN